MGDPIHNPDASANPPAPPIASEDDNAYKKRQENRDRWKLRVEIATALIILAYTVISILLWIANRHANEDANRNFRRDERAWMAFSFAAGNLTFTIGKTFLVPTDLLNTGKTTAKNGEGNIVVQMVETGEDLAFSYTPGHANYRVQAGTIFPGGHITESFEGIRHGTDQAEAIVITKPLFQDIISGRSLVVVHGKITYRDVFGTEHWTTYCRYVTNPSLISEE